MSQQSPAVGFRGYKEWKGDVEITEEYLRLEGSLR